MRLLADKRLRDTNLVNLYLVKVAVALAYVAQLAWPNTFYLVLTFVLLVSALLQVNLLDCDSSMIIYLLFVGCFGDDDPLAQSGLHFEFALKKFVRANICTLCARLRW